MKISSLIEYLSRLSKRSLLLLSLALVVIIGICDALTGSVFGFSLFYLLPIYLSTWFGGKGSGILVSFASALMWFLDNRFIGDRTYPHFFMPYWDTIVKLGFYLTIVFLESALKDAMARATIDPLTSVGNRSFFYGASALEIKRIERYKRPFTVAYLDIDNFKRVNDVYGHSTGDLLLKEVSKTVAHNIRSTDIFARLGGDEFALLLTETDAEAARNILPKLQKKMINAVAKHNWPVKFSIGAVTFFIPPSSVDDMIGRADTIMYSAKKKGKNLIEHDIVGSPHV